MATRTFNINTEPHQAVIGDTTLLFQPEAVGSDFVGAYTKLRDVQARLTGSKPSSTKHAKAEDISPESLRDVSDAMRGFVRGFLMTESHEDFDGMRLPDRILLQLVEYAAELYGGGSGNQDADGGTSTG